MSREAYMPYKVSEGSHTVHIDRPVNSAFWYVVPQWDRTNSSAFYTFKEAKKAALDTLSKATKTRLGVETMHTYIAHFEYEDNATDTMGAQSFMFDAAGIMEAAAIAEAFRAGLARNASRAYTVVKSLELVIQADAS